MSLIKSKKQRRMEDAVSQDRTQVPCVRCINEYAKGMLNGSCVGCRVGIDVKLWKEMLVDDVQAMRCYRCTEMGQDCFEVSQLPPIGPNWRKLTR